MSIDARASGEDSSDAPFIQVGTIAEIPGEPNRAQPVYDAFWSDGTLGDRPRELFQVSPNDEISASLNFSAQGWRVSIHDLTSRAQTSFRINYEPQAIFDHAEWLQADAHASRSIPPYPYPQRAEPAFRQLAINSTPPRQSDLESDWMSQQGNLLVPSRLTNDSFTLVREPLATAHAAASPTASGHPIQADEFSTVIPAGWKVGVYEPEPGETNYGISPQGFPKDLDLVTIYELPTAAGSSYNPSDDSGVLLTNLGLPSDVSDAVALSPEKMTTLAHVPAAAATYRYVYDGRIEVQSDVVAWYGSEVLKIEMYANPAWAPQGLRAMHEVLDAWRWL